MNNLRNQLNIIFYMFILIKYRKSECIKLQSAHIKLHRSIYSIEYFITHYKPTTNNSSVYEFLMSVSINIMPRIIQEY